ncbi:MAG: hypothetical protein ABF689_08420 [Gluconobacter cerinus]|uniref:hypothetical protein n=1 Tax=Gluconobacter cerinus TaxID=38307 RepID=UPI0039E77089
MNETITAGMLNAAAIIVAEKLRFEAQIAVARNPAVNTKNVDPLFEAGKLAGDIAHALHAIEGGYANYLAERDHADFPSELED